MCDGNKDSNSADPEDFSGNHHERSLSAEMSRDESPGLSKLKSHGIFKHKHSSRAMNQAITGRTHKKKKSEKIVFDNP